MPRQKLTKDERFERFWQKVIITKGCWNWTGADNGTGYGVFQWDDGQRYVHRISYEMHHGKIPEGLELDHKCRVRNCVNPDHLEPVTRKENCRRKPGYHSAKCKYGHSMEGYNVSVGAYFRRCRACAVERTREWRARDKARTGNQANSGRD